MTDRTDRSGDGEDYANWNKVYLAVIIYTILTIAGLWLLTRYFA